ncbi:DUF1861 family protein [Paenibacillus cymbidii]|uniref:DUF1861 family protein n=1 Tax=Paenibacillus cymbidii TaxID=1639034 RepID=UPI0010810A1C|nr:DUF1861 family protein [Paenibacillus cymbidii]
MQAVEKRRSFEQNKRVYESVKLTFRGADGFDVYNTSIPFEWQGKRYIYGRLERRHEWARSWVRLFEASGPDEWTVVPDSMIYQLEDPYVSRIGDEMVLGGTHVRFLQGTYDTFYGYFYRGTDLHDLRYFTTGPDHMKDIRLVDMAGGGIGVFSRPKGDTLRQKYGSLSMIGFTVLDSLEQLSAETIEQAPYIQGMFAADEWGGCNQAYLLDSGLIGAIGHLGYPAVREDGTKISAYMNMSFIIDPRTRELHDCRVIATRDCFPDGPAKKPVLTDCAFAAGIVMRPDGKADLYSGIGDTEAARIVIDDPFAGFGRIV